VLAVIAICIGAAALYYGPFHGGQPAEDVRLTNLTVSGGTVTQKATGVPGARWHKQREVHIGVLVTNDSRHRVSLRIVAAFLGPIPDPAGKGTPTSSEVQLGDYNVVLSPGEPRAFGVTIHQRFLDRYHLREARDIQVFTETDDGKYWYSGH